MILKSRARRAVISHFTGAKAFSVEQAITFAPRNDAETHALRRLTELGFIRQRADGQHFIDQECLAKRGKRRWMALAGLGTIAAGIAFLG